MGPETEFAFIWSQADVMNLSMSKAECPGWHEKEGREDLFNLGKREHIAASGYLNCCLAEEQLDF